MLFGQLVAALRRRRDGRVRLIACGEKAKLLAGLGAADEALDFDTLAMEEVFSGKPSSACSLPGRLGRCELLVSCFASGDPNAQRRLAELCSAREAAFLPIRPPEEFRGHLVDFWAGLAAVDSVPVPRWAVPAPWRQEARRGLALAGAEADRPYLLIHPGAGSPRKCWPLERFVALARLKAAPPSARQCVFLVGPAELDWWGPAAVQSLRREFPVLEAPPLAVLAGLGAGAAAYVGNDSGPTHLAAAVGTPTLALFGPSSPAHFAPRGRRVRVIAGGTMEAIEVESVLAALAAL